MKTVLKNNLSLTFYLILTVFFLAAAANGAPKANAPMISAYTVVLSTATVGTGGNYTTLKAAFDAVNAGVLTGAVTLQIISSTTETTMATLNASGTGSANYSSLLIYATGSGYSITGNVSNPLINLNGADNVVIDGRVNATGTTASLAITNTNTGIAACTLRYINSAENNIVRYTTISGSGLSAATAIIYFISSAAGNGNSTNVIEYCNITNAGGNRPLNALLSYGTAGRENSGNIIRFNNFYNFFSDSNNSTGINISGNSTDWVVSGNSFYDTGSLAPSGSYNYSPIKISTASMHTVTGNYIGGSQPLCNGTPWTMTSSYSTYFSGIFITGNTATATLVQNNTVKNLIWSSTSPNPWDGIYVASGNATLSGNTIGAGTGTNSIVVTTPNAAATATVSGGVVTGISLVGGGSGFAAPPVISFSLSGSTTQANATATISGGVVTGFTIIDGGAGYTSAPLVNINGGVYSTTHGIRYLNSATVIMDNNTIGAITTYGNNTYSHCFEGIVISGLPTSVITIRNNLIGSLTTASSIKTASPATSSLVKEDLRGIYVNSAVTLATITGNTIANLTSVYTGNSTSKVDGICSGGISNVIQNNIIRDLTSSAMSITVRGIQQVVALADGNQTITGNTIYNLSNTHATAPVSVIGIEYSGHTTGTNVVSGNFVYGLSIASANILSEIDGILLGNGVTTTSNNIINIGAGIATGYKMYGINDNSTNNAIYSNTIYFNSIYLAGTASGTTSSTAALWNTNNTSIRNYRNNILANVRTGGTTGKHYAIRVAGTQGLTINYNDYYCSGGTFLGSFSSSDKTTLSTWKTATGQDANSLNINPLYNIAGGNAPYNYYTSAALPAATGTGITTDYTGLSRSSLPKMGALETTDYVWSGATSTDFATASNWQNGLVPTNGSDISFAASPSNNCILDQDRSLRHITNAQGTYKLLLNGHKLTLTGNLVFSNNAKIDATAASSVIEFGGTTAQNIPSGALVSNTLDGCVINNGAGLTLNNDITVAQLLTLTNGALTIGAHTLTLNGIITTTSGTLVGGNTSAMVIGGTGAAALPAVTLNNLTVNRGTGISLAGSVAISGTLALTAGTVTLGANTLSMSGNSPTRVNGTIDASNAQATLAFTNAAAITLPNTLFTGNVSNLTINGAGGVTSAGNFTITGILDLQSGNPTATKGALDMWNGTSARTLTMGGNATTTGIGDTTGIIRRTSINAGVSYTFGNRFMKVYFANTGTLPSQISLKVSIGTTPSWRPGAINRDVEVIQTGAVATSAVVTYHYLDSELNGNDEGNLVLWTKLNDLEYGSSSFDLDDNWVSLSNVNLAFFSSAFDGLKDITLDEYSTNNTLTWNGSLSSSWTSIENWTPNAGPSSTKNIIIPDAATTPNDPVLPTVTEIKTINIEEGGILEAVASAQLTIDGTSAWSNSGTFNANTSNIIFNNAGATISGTTNFYNVTINAAKALSMTDGCVMRIGGAITNNGTWSTVVSGATVVEYNGGAQTVINPNGPTTGYNNLILSGTGTKTLSASLLAISGNFTLANTVTATAASAFSVNGNLVIGEGTTFGSGNFNHSIKGDFDNNGTFTASSGRTITLSGTTAQSILGTATTAFERLTINNASGVTLYSNVNVANLLTLTNGVMDVEAATLGLSGTITKTSGFIGVTPSSSLTIGGSGALALAGDLFSTPPSLNNLTINRTGGVTLGQDMTVAGTLGLTSGTLTIGTANLTIGSAGAIAVVSPNAGKMIIASGSGEVRKVLIPGVPFTYPVGDDTGTLQYSPVTLNLADDNPENNYFGVKVANIKHPDNASTVNYLNRYWSITRSGATQHLVDVSAAYVAADVTGTETAIASAVLAGNFNQANNPWVKQSALSGNNMAISGIVLPSGQTVAFTGIKAANPIVSLLGTGDYCNGANVPLQAVATADGSVLYSWTPPDFLSDPAIANPVATNITASTTYTVTIKDGNGIEASATGTVNAGTATTWNGAWSNGVPTATSAVIFDADFTATQNIEACTVVVNVGADIIIPDGFNMTVNGAVTVNGGTLTVENNANLVQVQNVSNTGAINVVKNSAPIYRLDYTMWSSPVAGETLEGFSPMTLPNRFYHYNPISDAYAPVPGSTTFESGVGYLMRAANDHTPFVNAGTPGTPWTGTFEGVPHNGNVNVAVVPFADPAGTVNDVRGYNAIGNPYPSSINIADFYAANANNLGNDTSIYFWRKKNDATASSYASLTLAAYISNNALGGDSSNGVFSNPNQSSQWVINSGQGFIVQAKTNTIAFTNAMRRGVNNGQFFRSAQDSPISRLWLNLNGLQGEFSQMAVAYTENTTPDLDQGWDGRAITDGTVAVYSLAGDSKLGIQARPAFEASDVVPVEYKITDAGTYTISLDHFDGVFAAGQDIFLRDNLLGGMAHNLTQSPYEFTTEAGLITGRFDVVYAETLGTDNPALESNNIIVYKQEGNIAISSGNVVMKSVAVYDIRGRLLYSANNINAAETVITGLRAQEEMLLVQVTTLDGAKTVKKIIY